MDTIFEACCELAVWLICELLFEYVVIGLFKLCWLVLRAICWIIGAALVFILTAGTVRPANKETAMPPSNRSRTIHRRSQQKFLEYNTVVFLGALAVTALTTVFIVAAIA